MNWWVKGEEAALQTGLTYSRGHWLLGHCDPAQAYQQLHSALTLLLRGARCK